MNNNGSSIEARKFRDAIDQDYMESAEVMWDLAQTQCYDDPVSRQSCRLYHCTYQYFMLLDLKRGIHNDSAFIIDQFQRLLCLQNSNRILVSGTADYSMLAHIKWAYRSSGKVPDITVVDRCQTALSINDWYANKHGFPVKLLQGDMFKLDPPDTFDVICTHNFLNNFPQDKQEQLLTRWFELLKPGGWVVTMTRLRQGNKDHATGFSQEQINSIRERTNRAVLEFDGNLLIDADTLTTAASEFARDYQRYLTEDQNSVLGNFRMAGLEIDDEYTASVSLATPDLHAPGGKSGFSRLRIVARKPG